MVTLLSQAQEDVLDVRFGGLRAFTELAWSILEPATPFIGNWHLDIMAEHLEAVHRCEINDLLINMPPRHMKSIEVAVMFPAWAWTFDPSIKWLYSSYAQSLSIRDSVKMRRVIESAWYRERWGDRFVLTSDQNQKLKFENDQTGYRMATSVGGSNTGEGGDIIVCLPYNSLITTDHGLIPIGRIVEERLAVRVLSYDHGKGSSFQSIEAYEENNGSPSVRLTFSNGAIVEGTEDHPLYVEGQGYVPLSEVPLGSRVVAHRKTVHCLRDGGTSLSRAHGESEECVLQSCVSWPMGTRQEQPAMGRREYSDRVSLVREDFYRHPKSNQAASQVLFETVLLCAQGRSLRPTRDTMCTLRKSRRDQEMLSWQKEILLSSMCEPRAQILYRGYWQRTLRAWSITRAVLSGLSTDRAEDSQAGWTSLLPLSCHKGRDWQRIGRASHRLPEGSRRGNESHHPLSYMPWGHARFSGQSEAMDYPIVVVCERIATPERVYNLRIARNRNYFANGILLHNCDDPHNVQERESDVMREGAIDWWYNVMSTRVNNPKKRRRVVVMQRVHEQDLAGSLLEQGGWTHLNLPAEYEGGKCLVTGCVFHWDKDPRTTEKELLWPARFGAAEVMQLKKDLGEQGAASQLQQRPAPAEGGILKRHWWKYWCHPGQEDSLPPVRMKLPDGSYKEIKAIPLPYVFDKQAQSWDMTFKDLSANDYVVGEQWGRRGPDAFCLDQVRGQMDFSTTLEAVRALNRTWTLPSEKVIEDAANGPAVLSVLKQEIPGLRAQPVGKAGKEARAAAYSHLVSAGNCYLPHPAIAPWVNGFIDECATFPNASHDDQVDTWSQAMDVLYAADDPGVAITPQYSARFHLASSGMTPVPGKPSFRFWYQGVYPCCVIGQNLPSGIIVLIDCVLGEQSTTIEELIDRKVIPLLNADYRSVTEWRDITNHGPLHAQSEPTEHHLDNIIRAKLDGTPEPGEKDFFTRLNGIVGLLSMTSRLAVNPAATPGETKPWIHEALSGGYAYRRDANGVISRSEPRKMHPLSSVGDALGHGISRIFSRVVLPKPRTNKSDAQKRANQYSV